MKINNNSFTPAAQRLRQSGHRLPAAYPQSSHKDYVTLLPALARAEAQDIRKTQDYPAILGLASSAVLSAVTQSIPALLGPVAIGAAVTLWKRNQANGLEAEARAVETGLCMPGAAATLEAHDKIHGWAPWRETLTNWYGSAGFPGQQEELNSIIQRRQQMK